MKLSKQQEEKLDAIKEYLDFEFDGTEESAEIDGERIAYLYVDYGLLELRGKHKFWGNWSRFTSEVCDDRRIDSAVDRRDMRDYEYITHCDHHSDGDDGIYRFAIAIGGSS